MKQHIHYVATADQVNIAWSTLGHGVPLVKAATWLTHLHYDLQSPIWAHWFAFLSERFRFTRYDERGCGMSDWQVPDLASPTHWTDDLEAVIQAAGIDRPFALLGMSQGAATAIRYAVRHPQRVSHLILYGGYALGCNLMDDPLPRETFRAVKEAVRLGWGSGNPTFRQMFTSRFVPDGTRVQLDWFNELCRRTVPPENANSLMTARGDIDVRDLLPLVRVPTLVLHTVHDQVVPFDQGRYLASHIPGAEFVELDSRNHVLLEHEPAWPEFCRAVLEFTGQSASADSADAAARLTARERKLLTLLGEARTNAQIAFQLGIAEKTVRNHFSNLYRKLGVRSRVEALVHMHLAHNDR
jgi:pimeloyl-ACP methyl ester carboxylesterase/DNA-binding CsgD family transcriptional regulator